MEGDKLSPLSTESLLDSLKLATAPFQQVSFLLAHHGKRFMATELPAATVYVGHSCSTAFQRTGIPALP